MEYNEVLKMLVNVTGLLGEKILELESVREISNEYSSSIIDDLRDKVKDFNEERAAWIRDNEHLRAQLYEEKPNLITRIRALRTLTGMNLKDSKAFLEALDKQVAQGGGGSAVADLSGIMHRAAPSMSASGGPNDTQGFAWENGVPKPIGLQQAK